MNADTTKEEDESDKEQKLCSQRNLRTEIWQLITIAIEEGCEDPPRDSEQRQRKAAAKEKQKQMETNAEANLVKQRKGSGKRKEFFKDNLNST